jgi:energy-coupling factor transport system ATP-binding protein
LGEIISIWKNCGKTIIIAEHRIHYLINISDRVIYMKDGKIERDFDIEEFKKLKRDEIRSLSLREFNIRNFEYNETFDNENHICLKNFYMKYGKRCVLDIGQINFPKGSVMAILGDNGAGKSTFVQHLCGLGKKPSGLMERDGRCHKGKKDVETFLWLCRILIISYLPKV